MEFLEAGRLAAHPLTRNEGDTGSARGELVEQRANESGIVLAVAIKRDDDRRARVQHTRVHCSRLTARSLVLDLAQPWPVRHQPCDFGFGVIGRAVVHIDDFVVELLAERARDLLHQWCDIRRLVAHGHDNGNDRRSTAAGR